MKIFNGVRTIGAARLAQRRVRRASIIFHGRKRKVILTVASTMLLLACGMGWAAPYPRGRAGGWVQPRASWSYTSWGYTSGGYIGVVQYGGYSAPRQQQRHQEHLPQWFRQHQYLSPQDQERALRSEPGFARLTPLEQQRLCNRLRQLNAMPPAKRERILERMEALERLSPDQREQVRLTMQQITQMPEDRRRMMHRAFRDLTQLPPWQRQSVLNSPQFKSQFSYRERQMLGTLMSVQPYSVEPRPGPGMGYGGR